MELLGYVAAICVGLVLGSIGAGGSMLAIPILVYLFAMDVETATAYSLFLVGTTSLTGALLKQRFQIVSRRTALLFGIPSIAGTFLSRKWIIVSIPDVLWKSGGLVVTKDHALLVLFCMLMITSSLILLLKKDVNYKASKKPGLWKLMCLGFFVGMIAGLVGAGGGFLIIPSLIIFARQPLPTVTLTSLLIIASNSLLGFCGDLLNRPIDWPFLFSITALSVSGLLLGYWLSKKVHPKTFIQRGFAWFTMAMALWMIVAIVYHE